MTDADVVFGVLVSLGVDEMSMRQLRSLCDPLGISDANLRSVLSRMHQRDVVRIRKEGRRAFYSLGERGRRVGSNTSQSFAEPDWSGWDGRYWLAAYTYADSRARYRIQKKLTAYRFRALYGGAWIRPYRADERVDRAFAAERSGTDNFDLAIATFPDGLDARRVSELYRLDRLAPTMRDAAEAAAASIAEIPSLTPEEAYQVRMTLGGELVTALAADPLLPPQLLPSGWPGTELRAVFREWNEFASRRAQPFVARALAT